MKIFPFVFLYLLTPFLGFLINFSALALPINFGRPLQPLEYKEVKSTNFLLYYDQNAPYEAQGLIRSLEAAKPHLDRWLGISREDYLPVIVSQTTDNASFANFLSDALELQTMGLGGRDLAWHELVHSTMYRYLDNIFGPAGSILHLPWMPAWWIEGLAEALTMSLGSAEIAHIEKWHALNDSWPSYDRLHSLYQKKGFAREGYGVAGSLVRYILTTYGAEKLPSFLEEFTSLSKPWLWPLTIVPFSGFMPMDAALQAFTGKKGEELYEEYKQVAKKKWSSLGKKDLPFFKRMASSHKVRSIQYLNNLGGRLTDLVSFEDKRIKDVELRPKKNGLGYGPRKRTPLEPILSPRIVHKNLSIYITSDIDDDRKRFFNIYKSKKSYKLGKKIGINQSPITKLFKHDRDLFWLENQFDATKLCSIPLIGKVKKKCYLKFFQPQSMEYLGQKSSKTDTKEIWLRHSVETLAGNRHKIIIFDLALKKYRIKAFAGGGRPLSVAFPKGETHLLVSGSNSFHVRKISKNGACLQDYAIPVAAQRLFDVRGKLYLTVRAPQSFAIMPALPAEESACGFLGDHRSPLLYAFQKGEVPLKEALLETSPWREDSPFDNKKTAAALETIPPTSKTPIKNVTFSKPREAAFRGRPLFAFPWIGADSGGSSLGIRSVPLMDEMQNETMQLNVLYGVQSRFPDLLLRWDSSRYKTYYYIDAFNRQTYNGSVPGYILYYKETGGAITFTRYFPVQDFFMVYGSKVAYFKPVVGPPQFQIEGQESAFSLLVRKNLRFKSFSWINSLNGISVPEATNKVWNYNKLQINSTVSVPVNLFGWRSGYLGLGVSGGRTRGKKMKFLKEIYRPLKTFVPGDGGGLNGASFPLAGPGLLTSALTGDTQANAKLTWTFPLIPFLDELVGIFYLERLDLTGFITYGGAWEHGKGFYTNQLIFAHGYNLDLATDIKGVTVNLGLGAGQVFNNDFEMYFKFSFDTLIDLES